MIFLGGSGDILYPGKIYRLAYVLKGFFEGLAFTQEDVYEAFHNTQKDLKDYGIDLSGKGIEDTSSLLGQASFNLYITVSNPLPLDIFNQTFLKYANKAGFPELFYEVYFVSYSQVSSSPEPTPSNTFSRMESLFKWAIVGVAIFYLAPMAKPALKAISDMASEAMEKIRHKGESEAVEA